MFSDKMFLFKEIAEHCKTNFRKNIKQFLRPKKYMSEYLEKAKFEDYPQKWNQSSFVYRQELINYLQINEYDFRNVIKSQKDSIQSIDISSISGIELSKSDLNKYASFYDFSLSLTLNDKYKFMSENDFIKNCESINSIWESHMKLVHQTWNGKIFIQNTDGSHRLAAIYRQCREQGRHYRLPVSTITRFSIDCDLIQGLLDKYYLVFSHRDNLSELNSQYYDLFSYETKQKMISFYLNARHGNFANSNKIHLLYLNKQYEFNNFVAEKLRSYTTKFLILNDEIKRFYLE